MNLDINHKTKLNNLVIKTKTTSIKPTFLVEEKNRFDALCRESCKNYQNKWSCPPFSPGFVQYSNKHDTLVVCLMYIELGQLNNIKNDYLKVKAANVIMKSKVDKGLRKIALIENGKLISTGSCRLCKPCRMRYEEPCRHPDIMGYSFEALGIDVGKLSLEVFNHKLLWYKKGYLPKYTSVVAGVLLNSELTDEKLQKCLFEELQQNNV